MVPSANAGSRDQKRDFCILKPAGYKVKERQNIMKHIICYGDSNTWGNTGNGSRYDDELQWPNILQSKLGQDYKVIQEGLRARIAGNYETEKPYLNGQSSFEAIYRSAMPVNVLIIALGTNDFKSKYARSAQDIYNDLLWYAQKAEQLNTENNGAKVEIIILAPANYVSKKDYFEGDQSIREELLELFIDCEYPHIMVSDLQLSEDGIHYSEQDHQKIATIMTQQIKEQSS